MLFIAAGLLLLVIFNQTSFWSLEKKLSYLTSNQIQKEQTIIEKLIEDVTGLQEIAGLQKTKYSYQENGEDNRGGLAEALYRRLQAELRQEEINELKQIFENVKIDALNGVLHVTALADAVECRVHKNEIVLHESLQNADLAVFTLADDTGEVKIKSVLGDELKSFKSADYLKEKVLYFIKNKKQVLEKTDKGNLLKHRFTEFTKSELAQKLWEEKKIRFSEPEYEKFHSAVYRLINKEGQITGAITVNIQDLSVIVEDAETSRKTIIAEWNENALLEAIRQINNETAQEKLQNARRDEFLNLLEEKAFIGLLNENSLKKMVYREPERIVVDVLKDDDSFILRFIYDIKGQSLMFIGKDDREPQPGFFLKK